MHEINCPWCGPRAQTEFEYLCHGSVVDSRFAEEAGPEALERIFIRDDSIGFHEEIWQHVLGCRGWLRVERHNRTHEIRSVVACRDGNGKGGS